MNSKLPSRPETSPNFKLYVIKIAHRATYIKWLWLQQCLAIERKVFSPPSLRLIIVNVICSLKNTTCLTFFGGLACSHM